MHTFPRASGSRLVCVTRSKHTLASTVLDKRVKPSQSALQGGIALSSICLPQAKTISWLCHLQLLQSSLIANQLWSNRHQLTAKKLSDFGCSVNLPLLAKDPDPIGVKISRDKTRSRHDNDLLAAGLLLQGLLCFLKKSATFGSAFAELPKVVPWRLKAILNNVDHCALLGVDCSKLRRNESWPVICNTAVGLQPISTQAWVWAMHSLC